MASKAKKLEKEVKQQQAEIEETFEERPQYMRPEEVQALMDLFSTTAEGMKEAAGEALGIAKRRAARTEMPGYDLLTQRILTTGAESRKQAQLATGGGISGLGAIGDIFREETKALQNVAAQNLAYQEQGEDILRLAFGTYGQELSKAAGLKGAGLQVGIEQGEQEFQINKLDPYYDQLNYKLAELGVSRSQLEALKNRRAQFWSGLISGIVQGGTNILSQGLNMGQGSNTPGAQQSWSGFGGGGYSGPSFGSTPQDQGFYNPGLGNV